MGYLSGELKKELLLGLAVAAVAFLVYANSLGNGFVWDDDFVIGANPAIRGTALSLFHGIDVGREADLSPYYRPLTLLTFLVEQRLHGLSPFPIRLFNILLHAANAFLVFRLARSFFSERYAALLAALLFAVHPLQAEGVDFNSGGRNTLLAAFFVLTAYLVHQWSAREEKTAGTVAGAALFLGGLLSKEPALAVLPFICFLEIGPLRGTDPGRRRKAAARLLPYAICTAVYFVLRNHALSGAGIHTDVLTGLGTRLLVNWYIVPRYLLAVLCPTSVSTRYFIPDDLNLLALPLGVSWLCILGLLGWLLTRGRSRATLFGLSWMAAFWLPVSGIFPIPSAPLADRYIYIPAIGLWLIVADQGVRAVRARAHLRRYALPAAGVILLALATVTVRRNMDWNSDISLFTRVIEQYPERAWGYHNLGCAYLDKVKDLDMAERAFDKALALDPHFPRLRTQRGYVRLLRGDYQGALSEYAGAIHDNYNDAEAHLNSAIALEHLGRYGGAATEYRRFLETPGGELAGARQMALEKVRVLSK